MRKFFDGESEQVPQFYLDLIRLELGAAYDYLPEGALTHDHNAYLKSEASQTVSRSVMPLANVRA